MIQMFDIGAIPRVKEREEDVTVLNLHTRVVDAQATVVPEKPKVDPAKVAAGIRVMCDYRLAPFTAFEKPITYVCYKNGIHEVRDSELVRITTKPKEILGISTEGKEGIEWKLPKVPFLFLQQTISFFRGVEAQVKSSSEALVQIWWDRTDLKHVMHVPEQTVSGGSVNHRSTFDQANEGRYLHVADIHSHGTGMGAFWSGTDNNDEMRVTTERLFGVIGKVTKPVPDFKWRMRTRDGFVDLTMADVFELPKESLTFTVKAEDFFRSMSNEATFKDGRVSLWCPVEPFTDVEVPAAWYEQVKQHQWAGARGNVHSSFPAGGLSNIKGFIYVNGIEYACEGTTIKATGHKLMTLAEAEQGARHGDS